MTEFKCIFYQYFKKHLRNQAKLNELVRDIFFSTYILWISELRPETLKYTVFNLFPILDSLIQHKFTV